jgi:hypothetical protein
MNRERYSFCFLRYHHDPLSGEFANVGVLLWAPDSSFLGFRSSKKFHRLSQFFKDFHHQDYRHLISRIDTHFGKLADQLMDPQAAFPFAKQPASARDLALQAIPHDDAALQWSPSSGGLTKSPEVELERLFHEAVAKHYEEAEDARRDEAVIYREVYAKAFEAEPVKKVISEHEVIAPLASYKFKLAWQNGVWNVYQPLSFDLKRAEDIRTKAFHWDSRGRFLSAAAERPKLHLLLGRPSGGNDRAYSEAKDVLASSRQLHIIEEDEAEDFARDLQARILAITA